MIILFKTDYLRKLCHDEQEAKRRLGALCAKKLSMRLDSLDQCDNLDQLRSMPGRCHELKGGLQGHLAIDLHAGCRLVFRPDHDPLPTKLDGGLDWRSVTNICVVAVEDYHG